MEFIYIPGRGGFNHANSFFSITQGTIFRAPNFLVSNTILKENLPSFISKDGVLETL